MGEPIPGAPAVSEFGTFVLSLATNAMLHLGALPDPDTNEAKVNLPLACQTIDILAMLQAKTKGNLDRPEEQLLERLLYDLRLRYVQSSKRPSP